MVTPQASGAVAACYQSDARCESLRLLQAALAKEHSGILEKLDRDTLLYVISYSYLNNIKSHLTIYKELAQFKTCLLNNLR
jgi:hypothetical protein